MKIQNDALRAGSQYSGIRSIPKVLDNSQVIFFAGDKACDDRFESREAVEERGAAVSQTRGIAQDARHGTLGMKRQIDNFQTIQEAWRNRLRRIRRSRLTKDNGVDRIIPGQVFQQRGSANGAAPDHRIWRLRGQEQRPRPISGSAGWPVHTQLSSNERFWSRR